MSRHLTSALLFSAILASAGLTDLRAQEVADEEMTPFAGNKGWQEDHEERLRWFREARFGMMIHWGLYSAAAGYWPPDPRTGHPFVKQDAEWIRTWASVPEPDYSRTLKPLFAPDPGCTEKWARLAKEAGMRYAVLTAKHHEGYTLFNSKADYSVANKVGDGTNISPPGRDLFREFTTSFRKQGIVPGAYYSLIDWQYPDPARYRGYLFQHLTELASNYGPLGILWVDYSSAGNEGSHWGTRSILDVWRSRQPDAIFNNRFWNGWENPNGDFFTPKKYVPLSGFPGRTFESSFSLNGSFGFSHHDTAWKSPAEIVRLLSDAASKNGNLILNVGPDAHGNIPEPAAQTLREVGKWLERYGEAIYGTTGAPLRYPLFNGRITCSSRNQEHILYCHLHEWPLDGTLSLDGLDTPCRSAHLLGGDELPVEKAESGPAAIRLPSQPPDPANLLPIVAIHLEGPPVFDHSPYPRQAADRSVTLLAPQAILGPSANATRPIRLEGNHIGYWCDVGESVWFPFVMRTPMVTTEGGGRQAGRFHVILDAAIAPEAGGEVEFRLLDQTLQYQLVATNHWADFHQMNIGTIELAQRGLMTLQIRPLSIAGVGLMNLRSVKLVPAN